MSPAYTLPLNGTNQYAAVPSSTALEIATGTIEMWVKPTWTPGSYGGANPGFVGERTANNSSTRFSLHLTDNLNGVGIWNSVGFLTVPYTFTPGQWYHIAAVLKAGSTEFFVNGVSAGSVALGINTNFIGTSLCLGSSAPLATAYEGFKGEIDEVRVWSTARTAAQIQAGMATTIASPATTSGLVAYYSIDQNVTAASNSAATLLKDYAANNLNSKLYNYWVYPTISSVSPARNAASVARNSNVAVTFSAAMDASSATALRVFGRQTGLRAGTLSGGGTNTLVFDPTQDLRAGEQATVTVTTAAKNQAGVALATPTVVQFTGAATSGTATFAAAYNETLASAYRTPGAVGDLNNDGNLDLVQPNGLNSGTIGIRLGTGTGQLTIPASNATAAAGTSPDNVALGDIDGDGDLDIVVSNGPYNISVLQNNGSAAFTTLATLSPGGFARAMALGDVDGDGDLDLTTTNSQYLFVFANNGSGTFTLQNSVSTAATFAANDFVENLTLGDVDGDGDLDALATNRNIGTVGVRFNNGAGVFSGTTDVTVGTYARSMAVADIDGDGDLDFVTANSNNTAPLSVRFNNGSGSFSAPAAEPTLPANSYGYSLQLGDLNADGSPDLLLTTGGNVSTYALLNNGTGAFALPSTGGVVATSLTNLWLGDFNNDGALDVASSDYTFIRTYLNQAAPAIVSFTPGSGSAGTQVVLMGANLMGASSVKFNGVAAGFTVNSATQVTTTVPSGATTGAISVTTPAGTATSAQSFTVTTDLVVSTAQTLSGSYRNVTVTGTGTLTLTGALNVTGTLTVQSGGQLNTKTYAVMGNDFVLADGATLSIGSAAGITATGSTGSIQTTTRSFAPDASYVYGSAVAGSETGSGLPAQVRNLSVLDLSGSATANVKLTNDLAIAQVLRLDYDLTTNGKALTLLSTPLAGSALVHNNGGAVQGTATVQRAIDPTLNSGLGYRQFSAPVSNTTVADLATAGFVPMVNSAYNTSATPTAETPFPTVYGYDQSRMTAANNLTGFDKGWESPAALTEALVPGKGYTVNLPASELVDFVGTLNNNDLSVPLSRTSGSTAADGGWQLLGNPYPSPLDLSQVAAADRLNLDAAVYISQSLGQYAGQYRAYVNNLSTSGTNSPVLPSGQGFFVRVGAGQTSGSFTFRNSQRVTTFDASTSLQRTTTDSRPQVHLALRGSGPASDAAIVYVEPGATAGLDGQYDAAKLPNTTGLNLSTALAGGQPLAIDGRPVPTASLTIPLNVYVPATGTYTLQADQLLNLNGLRPYLRDT